MSSIRLTVDYINWVFKSSECESFNFLFFFFFWLNLLSYISLAMAIILKWNIHMYTSDALNKVTRTRQKILPSRYMIINHSIGNLGLFNISIVIMSHGLRLLANLLMGCMWNKIYFVAYVGGLGSLSILQSLDALHYLL